MFFIKYFHITFMVIWFVSLFFLVRLFVWHAKRQDDAHNDYFRLMGRKLYFGITTPSAVLTVVFGIGLIGYYGYEGGWLPVKLALVSFLVLFHLYCGLLLWDLTHNYNRHSLIFYHLLNWFPMVIFSAVIALTAAKPVMFPFLFW